MRKREVLVEQLAKSGICAVCKGTKMLCGKSECPLLKRYYSLMRVQNRLSKEIVGSSPPEIFVGRFGYPKVYIGPMTPPVVGNTEYMGTPGKWIDMKIGEFVNMRTSLVRGMLRVNINDAKNPPYKIVELQEIAMGERHVDSHILFEKRPVGRIVAGSEVQPYGPRGKIEKFEIENVKVNPRIEKFYYDEVKAEEAIISLYKQGLEVSKLQRALSGGILGIDKKFVPTRWSITAVDDTLGRALLEEIKTNPILEQPMVFKSYRMGNIFIVIFLPLAWSYELVEAWYPGTLWNPYGNRIFMVSSHEFYQGRKNYAEIGGCYYAARLASLEKLKSMKRRAEVIVLREAQPSYLMPVGVWQVRENVRNALKEKARKFDKMEDAIKYALSFFHIPEKYWFKNSKLLYALRHQRRIEEFEIH